MYLIEFLKAMATGAILFVCFAFLLLWICVFWKKRKRRKKQPRQRMERGSPKIYPRRLPIGGHGQIVDLEMQNYCDGDQNGRSNSSSTMTSEIVTAQNLRRMVIDPSTLSSMQAGRKSEMGPSQPTACQEGNRSKETGNIQPGAKFRGQLQNSELMTKKIFTTRSTVPATSRSKSGKVECRLLEHNII